MLLTLDNVKVVQVDIELILNVMDVCQFVQVIVRIRAILQTPANVVYKIMRSVIINAFQVYFCKYNYYLGCIPHC